MRRSIVVCGLVLAVVGVGHAQIKFTGDSTVVFATAEQGKKILMTRDDFIRALSPFDLAARMKTDRDVSEEAFLEFVGQNVLDWTQAEEASLTAALDELRVPLGRLALPWPKVIYAVKTTGQEEGGVPYTRGEALVLPKTVLGPSRGLSATLICHELFHILSRSNPDLRERLYAAIGFVKCGEVDLPDTLLSRKITNPDAPANDHCIRVQVNGADVWAVPILFSRTEKYDAQRGGDFFRYMQFQFLLVEREENSPRLKPAPKDQPPRLVRDSQITGFFEQVGRNTQYIIHPEEILADNFASLVLSGHNAPSPEILRKLREALLQRPPAGPSRKPGQG